MCEPQWVHFRILHLMFTAPQSLLFLCFCCCLLFSGSVSGQPTQESSTQLCDSCQHYLRLDPEKAEGLCGMAVQQSLTVADTPTLARAYHLQAKLWVPQGKLEEAIELFQKAYDLRVAVGDLQGGAKSLNNLAVCLREQGLYREAIKRAGEAILIKRKLGDEDGEATSLRLIANCYLFLGKYDSTRTFVQQALNIHEQTGNEKGKASCYNTMGASYWDQGHSELALENYQKAVQIYTELGRTYELIGLNHNIAVILVGQHRYAMAKAYHEANLTYARQANDLYAEALAHSGLGNIYADLKQWDAAKGHFQQAIELQTQLGNPARVVVDELNLGIIEASRGNGEEGIRLMEAAYALMLANDYRAEMANGLIHLGIARTRQYGFRDPGALQNLQEGLALAQESGSFLEIKEAAALLSEIYALKGDAKQAATYFDIQLQANDSLESQLIREKLAELEAKYESEKQAREILDLSQQVTLSDLQTERQKRQRNGWIAVTLLAGLLSAILYLLYRIKQKSHQRLTETHQFKSRLFSEISHELRTPITLVMGELEAVTTTDLSAEQQKRVKQIGRSTRQLRELSDELMELAGLEIGQIKLQTQEGNIGEFIQLQVENFQGFAQKRAINLSIHLPETPIVGWYDPEKMQKILYNLVSNALHHTPDGGEVSLRLAPTGDTGKNPSEKWMQIYIEDNGSGIEPAQLSVIFQRYTRGKTATNRNATGLGIGLSLVAELVKLMGGEIEVSSEVGEGTTFSLALPYDAEHLRNVSEEATAPIKLTEPIPVTEKEKVPLLLIVDDHVELCEWIAQACESSYRIRTAHDGSAGWEIAAEELPDMIISDLMMPKMDGVEFCHKIKTDDRTSHIPFLLLSAMNSVEDRIESFQSGADEYLTKPFQMAELKARMSNLMAQRERLRKRFSRNLLFEPIGDKVESLEERFLRKVMTCIAEQFHDADFGVEALTQEVGISRAHLYRKLKALTSKGPNELIRTYRVRKAAGLFKQQFGNVSDVAYSVGFNNLSYFAKCFGEAYGVSPSVFVQNQKISQN